MPTDRQTRTIQEADRHLTRADHYLYGDGSGSVEGHTTGIGFALLAVAAEIRALRESLSDTADTPTSLEDQEVR